MEHGKWYFAFGLILAVLCLLGSAYFLRASRIHPLPAAAVAPAPVVSRPLNLTGLSIYTDGENGFSLFYPASDALMQGYGDSALLPSTWRLGATATGTSLISITDTVPNATTALVRLGVSQNKQEVRNCLRASPGESPLSNVTLGGTSFKTFSFDRIGTDDEVMVTSYRAVHNGACVAIESFLSSNVASSTNLTGIVRSFSFARP